MSATWSDPDDLSLASGPRPRRHGGLPQRGPRRAAAGSAPPAPVVAPAPAPDGVPRPRVDPLGARLRRAPGALPAGLPRGHRPRRARGGDSRSRHLGRRPRRRRDGARQLALPARARAGRPALRRRELDGLVRAARGGPAPGRRRVSLPRARARGEDRDRHQPHRRRVPGHRGGLPGARARLRRHAVQAGRGARATRTPASRRSRAARRPRGCPRSRSWPFVGDNIQDFPEKSQAIRERGDEAFADFGARFFVLPNPMYGSWEKN